MSEPTRTSSPETTEPNPGADGPIAANRPPHAGQVSSDALYVSDTSWWEGHPEKPVGSAGSAPQVEFKDQAVFVLKGRPGEQTIAATSQSLARLTGLTIDQLLGVRLRALVDPEVDASTWAMLTRCLVRREAGHGVIRIRRPDGESLCADLYLVPAETTDDCNMVMCSLVDREASVKSRDAQGELFGKVSLARDEWLRALDSLSDLIVIVDSSLRVIRANRTLERWGLASVTDVTGRDLHSVLHSNCCEDRCYVEALRRALADSRGARSLDWSLSDPALGRRLQVMVHSPTPGPGKTNVDTATIIVRDTTALHRLLHSKLRTNRVDAMRHIVDGLAHEIGNPAAAMKATVDVWERCFSEFSGDEHRAYLARLRGGVDRLLETVRRVLGRGEDGVLQLHPIPVGDVLRRAAEFLADKMSEKDISCEVIAPCDEQPLILGDPLVVDQVMRNLIENSIEACGPRGRISLEALVGPGWVEVSVRDDGCGMASHTLEKLFLPFFTTRPSGTGLGLAHVSRWMNEMGGDIEVQSSVGSGTVITLRFRIGPVEGPGPLPD